MRPMDLETGGEVWVYGPPLHKTAHHGHARTIYLGPQAQAVVRPFLVGRPVDAPLFSPAEAEFERNVRRRAARRTPVQPSQVERAARAAPRARRRGAGCRYDVGAYRRAIARACDRAGVPRWHPHQLRHNAATTIRREFGLEAARILLGHHSLSVTEIYAEQDRSRAREVVLKLG